MIARREFLEMMASLPAVKEFAFRAVSVLGNVYTNTRLSLQVERPEGWDFSSIADFAALRERQVLEEAEDLQQGPHPLKDPDNLPAFLFECARHRNGSFSPCIALYDDDLQDSVPSDEETAHEMMLDRFSEAYRDLRIRSYPRDLRLNGAQATLAKWSYQHVIDTGEMIHLSILSLLVFREPRVHTFYLVDSLPQPCIHQTVWNQFIASIHYTDKRFDPGAIISH